MQGKAGSLHPSWTWRHLQDAHFLPEYGDIPRVEASPVLGRGHRNPCFASLASSCSPPRWCRSHFCTLCRELRHPPPLRPRWKTEGGGVRGTGRLPSKPLRGPLAPAGGIKARRLLASVSLGWLPGSVPGETARARGLEAPKSF